MEIMGPKLKQGEFQMTARSSANRYGSVAIAIHWASATGVILAFIAGLVMANSAEAPAGLLIAHIVLGTCVLVLTLLRILWWAVADKHPAPPANQPRWQVTVARIVHGLLYVILILMGSSGIATIIASGAIPMLASGQGIPEFDTLIPRVAHGVMSKLLLGLFVIHVGAALYHQFIRRDQLLARMGVGSA